MRITAFQPDGDLIVVPAWIAKGPDVAELKLVLDTGATDTLITPAALARIGYGPQHTERTTVIRSPLGAERGFLLHLERFSSLGVTARRQVVHAHELPEQYDLDGLLGLSFLHRLDYTVYSKRGVIAVDFARRPSAG